MFNIPFKAIRAQLKADLIGKDSYRGITLTYAWMANQFGHFSLGFIPTFVTFLILSKTTSCTNLAFWSALLVSSLWLLFEIYNFLGPLLLNRITASKGVYVPSKSKYTFQPKWANVAFDTSTDVLFFVLGSFACGSLLDGSTLNISIAVTTQLVLLYPIAYWFVTKMYQMNAVFPFQFRLSQWNLKISDADKQVVDAFLSNTNQGKHLMCFGQRDTGKSSLAVGIGNELAIAHQKVTYATSVKLCAKFHSTINENDRKNIWEWDCCDVLIIDDMNPGVGNDIISAEEFKNLIDNSHYGEPNKECLVKKNVIWVLGDGDLVTESLKNSWKSMLEEIGVKNENISEIKLRRAD